MLGDMLNCLLLFCVLLLASLSRQQSPGLFDIGVLYMFYFGRLHLNFFSCFFYLLIGCGSKLRVLSHHCTTHFLEMTPRIKRYIFRFSILHCLFWEFYIIIHLLKHEPSPVNFPRTECISSCKYQFGILALILNPGILLWAS